MAETITISKNRHFIRIYVTIWYLKKTTYGVVTDIPNKILLFRSVLKDGLRHTEQTASMKDCPACRTISHVSAMLTRFSSRSERNATKKKRPTDETLSVHHNLVFMKVMWYIHTIFTPTQLCSRAIGDHQGLEKPIWASKQNYLVESARRLQYQWSAITRRQIKRVHSLSKKGALQTVQNNIQNEKKHPRSIVVWIIQSSKMVSDKFHNCTHSASGARLWPDQESTANTLC